VAKIITFESIDGSGKTADMESAAWALRKKGKE
jgi:thymidylate kinase